MADLLRLKEQYLEEAIANDAGHILVAKQRGLRVYEMAIELYSILGGLGVKRFATRTARATDQEIPELNPARRESLTLTIAGGVAGQMFEGKTATRRGTDHDHSELARLNTGFTLEEVAKRAVLVIREQEPAFHRLSALIRQRCLEFIKRRDLKPGMYVLLNEREIEAVLAQKD